MSKLTERILSEAAIAGRPGSLIRLETIAADVAALEQQIAERDAVIERVKAAWFGPCAFDLRRDGPTVTDALTAAPESVLAEVKREAYLSGLRDAREAVGALLADPAVYTTASIDGVVQSMAAIDALIEKEAQYEAEQEGQDHE